MKLQKLRSTYTLLSCLSLLTPPPTTPPPPLPPPPPTFPPQSLPHHFPNRYVSGSSKSLSDSEGQSNQAFFLSSFRLTIITFFQLTVQKTSWILLMRPRQEPDWVKNDSLWQMEAIILLCGRVTPTCADLELLIHLL